MVKQLDKLLGTERALGLFSGTLERGKAGKLLL